MLKQCIR